MKQNYHISVSMWSYMCVTIAEGKWNLKKIKIASPCNWDSISKKCRRALVKMLEDLVYYWYQPHSISKVCFFSALLWAPIVSWILLPLCSPDTLWFWEVVIGNKILSHSLGPSSPSRPSDWSSLTHRPAVVYLSCIAALIGYSSLHLSCKLLKLIRE